MPQMFGTITVTDGISMGTEGMKYSLVSREVIADAIETATQSQFMDGVLAIGGCDKNLPGAMIGIMRMNVPAICVYGGTIKPGKAQGPGPADRLGVRVRGLLHRRARCRRKTSSASRGKRCPASARAAACTPRTRCPRRWSGGPVAPLLLDHGRRDEEKRESAAKSMEVLVAAVKANLKPSDIVTKKVDRETTIAVIMATGGSDQRRAALARDRAMPRASRGPGRLRARAPEGAGAVRPEALPASTSPWTCTKAGGIPQ
jgi:dihydroxy-acid dehydratase